MTDRISCPLDSIPQNGCKGLASSSHPALDTAYFAVRQGQQLFVYRNRCPHLGIPLEWMPDQFLDRDGCYIQCATHGALFRIDNGQCVAGPCEGEFLESIPFRIEAKSLIIDEEPTAK